MIRRCRKFTLWTGTTLCVLIATTFAASGWWWIELDIPGGPVAFVISGELGIGCDDPDTKMRLVTAGATELGLRHWLFRRYHREAVVALPLYSLFLAVALPTLLVWRVVPKFPPGHCRRCGYNLTGLVEPRCPECGPPFEAKSDAP